MIKSLFLGICIYCVFPLKAQEKNNRFSLEQALEYSANNNLSLKNAILNVEHSKKEILDITSIGLPQVNGGFSYNYFLDRPVSLIPGEFLGLPSGEVAELRFGTDHNAVAEIQASQLILDPKYIVGLSASKALLKLSREELEKAKIDLKESVTLQYYSVLLLLEQKRLLSKNIKTIEEVLIETESMYKEGFADDIQYKQIGLIYKDMQNQLLLSDRKIIEHTSQLKLIMGFPISDSIELSLSFNQAVEKLLLLPGQVDTFDFSKHVDYRLVKTNAQLQKLNTWSERASFLPNVKILYSLQQTAQRNEFDVFDFNQTWYRSQLIGLKVNVPVFSSFQKMAKLSKAKLSYIKAKNIQGLTEQSLKLTEQNSRFDYLSSIESYNNEKENLSLAKSIFEKTTIKYKEGMSSSFELNESRRQELMTQNNFLNAAMRLFKARVALQKSTGIL